MTAGLRAGVVLAVLGTATVVAALPEAAPAAQAATSENRVAVIVDTGEEVKKVCVRFSEASITGAEALRRADVDPVFASYSGQGQAVCSLCGVGCPANDCFCDARRFWAYHRASYPEDSYTFSRAGAASTELRDGDVEGWKWGRGEAPPFASVVEVCGGPEPRARQASTTTSTTSRSSPTTTSTSSGAATGDADQPARLAPAPSGGGAARSETTSTTANETAEPTTDSATAEDEHTGRDLRRSPDDEPPDEQQAARPSADEAEGDGSLVGPLAAGAMFAALAGSWFYVRRRNSRPTG